MIVLFELQVDNDTRLVDAGEPEVEQTDCLFKTMVGNSVAQLSSSQLKVIIASLLGYPTFQKDYRSCLLSIGR